MTDKFDLRKYLVENKVTTNSKLLKEVEVTPDVSQMRQGKKSSTSTKSVNIGQSRGDFGPSKVQVHANTQPKQLLLQMYKDSPEYEEEESEFLQAFKIPESEFYLFTDSDESYDIIGPQYPRPTDKYAGFWEALESEDFQTAEDLATSMTSNCIALSLDDLTDGSLQEVSVQVGTHTGRPFLSSLGIELRNLARRYNDPKYKQQFFYVTFQDTDESMAIEDYSNGQLEAVIKFVINGLKERGITSFAAFREMCEDDSYDQDFAEEAAAQAGDFPELSNSGLGNYLRSRMTKDSFSDIVEPAFGELELSIGGSTKPPRT
jgi:hypothetical protein